MKAREKTASLLLMSLHEDFYQRFMDVFGRNNELKLREVYDIITGSKKGSN